MNKKIRRVLLNLSLFMILLSAIIVIDKILPVLSFSGAWCNWNPSCITSPCFCDTGNKTTSSCSSGKWSPSGSDSSLDCKYNCAAGTTDGFSYAEIKHSKSVAVSKPPCYRSSGGEYTATATCNNSVVTISNVSSLSCYYGYKYTYGSWYENTYGCYYVCVYATCSAGTTSGYSYSSKTHYQTFSATKSISYGDCTGSLKCNDGSVTLLSESCTCDTYYSWNGSYCYWVGS